MFFDPSIILDLRNLLPWAGELFLLITNLGSDYFYIGILLIGFWTIKKRESIIAAFVLLTTIVLNFWVKILIANPRPDQSYWYSTDIDAPNYSTPSGHAQHSATFYGWLSLKVKTWWMVVISITLSFLIGISRVYLGVHYFEDVLIGWALGIAVPLLIFLFYQPLERNLSRIREEYLYLGLFILSFALLIIQALVFPILPLNDNFGAYGGMVMGIAIAIPLEKRYVSFDIAPFNGQKWRLVVRCLVGLILVIVSLAVLGLVMPSSDVWLRALRYIIIINIGVFIWPLIFTKLKL